MSVHQVVSTAQAQTPDRSRETVRERWRMTLLSARERDECAENAMLAACAKKSRFCAAEATHAPEQCRV